MPMLYCDESGFTGSDLLSEVQPFLVVSSLLLNETEVSELALRLQDVTQAEELKYSTLVKWPKSRKELLVFTRRLDGMQEKLRFQISNKRFALLGKIVDLLAEPVFHAQDIDFYADGQNLVYLNTLYFASLTANAERDDVLREFLVLCRQATDEQFGRLADALVALSSQSDVLTELCKPILIGVQLRRQYDPSSLDKADLALMTTSVISLVRQWNQELQSDVSIVADASNELFRSQDVLAMLSDEAMPEVAEVSADRVLGLPLRIAGLELVDSKARLGVQLADVAAGIVNHVQVALDDESRRIDDFTGEVSGIVTEWPRMLQIIPEAKFTAEQLGRTGFDGSRILNATIDAFERRKRE